MSNQQRTLSVSSPEGVYPIYIGSGLLSNPDVLTPHILGHQVCIVTNDTVAAAYLPTLLQTLSGYQLTKLVLPDGEQHKTLATFSKIIDAMVADGHHRDTTVIALGGGVIGDMAGFAAACYQRGVNVMQIPTTLLSQVDSSVGGKTAVNHPQAKNFIGAFHQPTAVVIDIDTLETLPKREFLSGLAEVLKAALIKDADFVAWLMAQRAAILARDKTQLLAMIARACTIKQAVIERDAKERGERVLLNFGHTFAHAIEQCVGYGQWLHGEAVGLGMLMASDLSRLAGILTDKDHDHAHALLQAFDVPKRLPKDVTPEQLLDTIRADKKTRNAKLHWVLLEKIGHAVVSTAVTESMVLAVINAYR